jgi:hypothetical protein
LARVRVTAETLSAGRGGADAPARSADSGLNCCTADDQAGSRVLRFGPSVGCLRRTPSTSDWAVIRSSACRRREIRNFRAGPRFFGTFLTNDLERCCRKFSGAGTRLTSPYPGLAGRQLAAGIDGQVPAHDSQPSPLGSEDGARRVPGVRRSALGLSAPGPALSWPPPHRSHDQQLITSEAAVYGPFGLFAAPRSFFGVAT